MKIVNDHIEAIEAILKFWIYLKLSFRSRLTQSCKKKIIFNNFPLYTSASQIEWILYGVI